MNVRQVLHYRSAVELNLLTHDKRRNDMISNLSVLTVGLAVAAALGISPATAQAQLTCSATINPHIDTPAPYVVGDIIDIHLSIGVNDIEGGATISISEVKHDLDCQNGGLVTCPDDGAILEYEGDAFLTTTCAGVAVASNVPAGGSATNELVFTFTPALVLNANSSCDVQFKVQILSLSTDNTPKIIQAASGFAGTCDNQLDGNAGGTLGILISSPSFTVSKDCADGGAGLHDVDITVNNTGDIGLANCQVTDQVYTDDSNGVCPADGTPTAVAVTPSPFNLAVGGQQIATGSAGPLNATAVNNVSVTCEVAGRPALTLTQSDCDECVVILACCLPDGTCQTVSSTECEDLGGTPHPDGECTTTQACCLPDGSCQNMDPLCCLAAGGTPGGDGSACTAPEACCLPDSTCILTDPVCCTAAGGTPEGAGSVCTQPEGCCPPEGTCAEMDPLCCADQGGQPGGAGSACTASEACCVPDSTCISTDPVCCVLAGGTPEGPGSECTQTEACCLPDGTCAEMDPLCCADLGGQPQGAGTICTSTTCGGGEGCTPGYWKQPQHFGNWTPPYTPSTQFSAVFENAFPGKTLLQVLSTGGGGLEALGRHTVSALLNAASSDVDYGMTPQEVIDEFNAVYPGTKQDYEALKNTFAGLNERNCPLARAPAP